MLSPNLLNEMSLWKKDYLVVGIDEVGRGAFAGPLLFGATILAPNLDEKYIKYWQGLGIKDSKKLTNTRREMLSKVIQKEALHHDFEAIEVSILNTEGLALSMKNALNNLSKRILNKFPNKKIFFLNDAFSIDSVDINFQKPIIHGDNISITIACASIIAKVKRDKLMVKLSKNFPLYSLEKNKGYGTLEHRVALKMHGKCKIHRDQFVRKFVSI